jgi:protease PrsW
MNCRQRVHTGDCTRARGCISLSDAVGVLAPPPHTDEEMRVTEPGMFPSGAPRPAVVPVAPAALLRRPRSALTWVTMIVLGLGGLMIAILIFLLGGPADALIATLLAAVSFPVMILICFWLDRYEPEPAGYRLAALGWGAVAAVVLSFIGERLLFGLPGTNEFVNTVVGAPVVEEFAKGLFLVAIVIFRRAEIDGLLDGIIYGALVAIGFAFVEDIVYYLQSLQSGQLGVTFFLRGIMGPFAHPLFTAATGIGIGIAVSTRRPAARVLAPILGFLAAIVMHAIWNGSTFWDGGNGFLLAYGAIMLPLLVVILAVAIWARSREGRMLSAALHQVAQMGWLRPDEIRWIARLSDRMSARAYAKRVGGRPAAAALRAYQQTVIEVAFLHSRALNGTAPDDLNQRMNALLQRASWLRPYVIFPPPQRATWPPPGLPEPWVQSPLPPDTSAFRDRRR